MVLAWQRKLGRRWRNETKKADDGSLLPGTPLAPNTIRLARAPLSGAFKLAVSIGAASIDPTVAVPRPKRRRSIPKHWTPDQAREFLSLMQRRPDLACLGIPTGIRNPHRRTRMAAMAER